MNRAPPRREALRRAALERVESWGACGDHTHEGPEKFWIPPCEWAGRAPERDARLISLGDIIVLLADFPDFSNFGEYGGSGFHPIICDSNKRLDLCLRALARISKAGRALALIAARPDAMQKIIPSVRWWPDIYNSWYRYQDFFHNQRGRTSFQSWTITILVLLAIGKAMGSPPTESLSTLMSIRTRIYSMSRDPRIEELRRALIESTDRAGYEFPGPGYFLEFPEPGVAAWATKRIDARVALIP